MAEILLHQHNLKTFIGIQYRFWFLDLKICENSFIFQVA
jgi:hypothetical protein